MASELKSRPCGKALKGEDGGKEGSESQADPAVDPAAEPTPLATSKALPESVRHALRPLKKLLKLSAILVFFQFFGFFAGIIGIATGFIQINQGGNSGAVSCLSALVNSTTMAEQHKAMHAYEGERLNMTRKPDQLKSEGSFIEQLLESLSQEAKLCSADLVS